MPHQKLLEKLIDEGSKILSLSINSIVKLGQAHPVLALKILAVPVACISISIPMFAGWLILTSLSTCPTKYNRSEPETNDSHLEQWYNSLPPEKTSDRKPLNEPSTMLPPNNEVKGYNRLSSPNFYPNTPADRNREFSNVYVIPNASLSTPENHFIPSNSAKNDNRIDLDLLLAFLDDELLNELNSFETLILPNGNLSSNLDRDNLLSNLNPSNRVNVPEPISVIALLAIAGFGTKILKKK